MSNKKIGVLTTSFNENLVPVTNQFKDFNLQHNILLSRKPWNGDWDFSIEEFYLPDNVELIVGDWNDQAEQLNFGLEDLRQNGFEWALIVDADEFYIKTDIKLLLMEIELCDKDAIVARNMEVFWKTPQFRISPKQDDNPIIAIRTDKRFSHHRVSECSKQYSNTILYHFSYVRTNQEMLKKIDSFGHAYEFDREYWFNKVWLTWGTSSRNFHPTVPEKFEYAYYDPAPQEIITNFYSKMTDAKEKN